VNFTSSSFIPSGFIPIFCSMPLTVSSMASPATWSPSSAFQPTCARCLKLLGAPMSSFRTFGFPFLLLLFFDAAAARSCSFPALLEEMDLESGPWWETCGMAPMEVIPPAIGGGFFGWTRLEDDAAKGCGGCWGGCCLWVDWPVADCDSRRSEIWCGVKNGFYTRGTHF